MKFQFQAGDLEIVGKVRNTWYEAAMDAVAAGYATWGDFDELVFLEHGSIAGIVEGSVPGSNKTVKEQV